MAIKAKPTRYGGIEFRSRLEARWAVFFDALGIEWRYEHRWFDLPSGSYLPDFWLPELHYLIEIKPAFEQKAVNRLSELSEHEDNDGDFACFLLTEGDLRIPSIGDPPGGAWRVWAEKGVPHYFDRQWWGYCEESGTLSLDTEAIDELWCGHADPGSRKRLPEDALRLHDVPHLRTAFQKAQRARF